MDNLRLAYCKARRGKRHRPDVLAFEHSLETNLRTLRNDLLDGSVTFGPYSTFVIYEPKERTISFRQGNAAAQGVPALHG